MCTRKTLNVYEGVQSENVDYKSSRKSDLIMNGDDLLTSKCVLTWPKYNVIECWFKNKLFIYLVIMYQISSEVL